MNPAFTPSIALSLPSTSTNTTSRSQLSVPRRARTPPKACTPLPVSTTIITSPSTSNSSSTRRHASSPTSKQRYLSHIHTLAEGSHDALWQVIQEEARAAAEEEPLLASFLFATILNHRSLHSALAFHLANKLSSPTMPSTMLMRLFQVAMDSEPSFCCCLRADLISVMERDPACTRFIDALLYFKGFHALQAYRVAHVLWKQERAPLAYHLQSQVSKELQVDIHPAAVIGEGFFIDHATGIVIGETAVIGKRVSMLHHVTLGGSGKKHGDRHPKLGDGVLVGAGATLLGNVKVGDGVQIGACSLVLEDIPAYATVVGVPAKVVGRQGMAVPAMDMKHERCLPGCTDKRHGHETDHVIVEQDHISNKIVNKAAGKLMEKAFERSSINGVDHMRL